jgi:hypothetical protein
MCMAKANKKRAGKYEEKPKIPGRFEELIGVSVGKLPEKQPLKPAEEDIIPDKQEGLKKQDKPIK